MAISSGDIGPVASGRNRWRTASRRCARSVSGYPKRCASARNRPSSAAGWSCTGSGQTESPAAAAGCQHDDLIVAIDGVTVGSIDDAEAAFAARPRDDTRPLVLSVLRDGRIVDLPLSPPIEP